jgi:hypothetical protein
MADEVSHLAAPVGADIHSIFSSAGLPIVASILRQG